MFDQGVGLLETFLESVPSTIIMTAIWVRAGDVRTCENMNTIFAINSCLIIFSSVGDTNLSTIVSNQRAVFRTTFTISIISASLSLAKCLMNGVARPIGPGGTLDELMNFVVAFLASALSLMAIALCIAFTPVIIMNSDCKHQATARAA